MLLFTPQLCGNRDPLDALERTLDSVDAIQIRPKALGCAAPGEARETFTWCVRVLDLLAARGARHIPVIVNDRVDVARALRSRGCAGVHLGQDDCPVEVAREQLGPEPLIGLSTHDLVQVASAGDMAVDYLGFGPIHETRTRGYVEGIGPERAWIASAACPLPMFAIGGIDATNAADLARIGRAAVGSAILSAPDPGPTGSPIRRRRGRSARGPPRSSRRSPRSRTSGAGRPRSRSRLSPARSPRRSPASASRGSARTRGSRPPCRQRSRPGPDRASKARSAAPARAARARPRPGSRPDRGGRRRSRGSVAPARRRPGRSRSPGCAARRARRGDRGRGRTT